MRHIRRTTQGGNHLGKAFHRRAGTDGSADAVIGRGGIFSLHHQELGTKCDGQIIKARRHGGIARQNLHTDGDLHRIAQRRRQRLVHVAYQGRGPAPGPIGGIHQGTGQRAGLIRGFHECARATFDIKYQAFQPRRQLLGQDRGGNQIDALYRRGHIADRVKAAVCRRDLPGGADNRAAHFAGYQAQLLFRNIDVEAGYRLQLVQRPAGMAQSAP